MSKRFDLILYGVLIIFLAVMTHATYRAYAKKPGSTGQDIAEIQKIRAKSFVKETIS